MRRFPGLRAQLYSGTRTPRPYRESHRRVRPVRSAKPPPPTRTYHTCMAIRTLYTIGHSTHSIEEFIGLLQEHKVAQIADVRSIPKSRHCPQFNAEVLGPSLREAGIGYTEINELDCSRYSRKVSINTGWRN